MKALFKNFIKILFYLHLLPGFLASQCNLNYNGNWLNEWRLLITEDRNHQYSLVRDRYVPANKNIILVCNAEPKWLTATCKANQRFNIALPVTKKCKDNEGIQPIRRQERAAYCQYTLYKIGYEINRQFLETYQVCFDHKHMRPVFTINKAYPVGGSRPDFLQFNTDDIFYGNLFHAFDRRSVFNRFKALLGNKQKYMSESNVNHIIDRGHMTPSADFTLTNLKRSTFNMINVIPQFKTIDNGNWRLIEEWSRRIPSNVCTGVLDCNLDGNSLNDLKCVVQLKDTTDKLVPMFLADNRKIPIPLWSYKIVKNNKISMVFLTLNNIYQTTYIAVSPDVCTRVKCPSDLNLNQRAEYGRTWCCSYNEFITKNVPHLTGLC